MVLSEWDKILSASPQDLSEQDKEEFFEKLAWTDLDINLSHDNVIQLLRVSQEILKFKGEQVEYLVNELDTLAAVQSDDTGGKRNISDHADVSHKNYDTNSEELARAQIKNEELYAELQEKERDFLNEKRQVEKLTEQITVLEQEKNEVQRELAALQRETRELQEGRMRSSSPDMASEKVQELTEAVRQKNKHITQLLSDIETIERENTILKEKLSSVKDELEDATHQMTKLAGDSTSLHHTVKEQQLQIDELEEQNVALRRQVSELVADKHNTDDQLDQLGLALDSRLLQWQDLLEKKDAELRELKQQLALSSSQTPVLQLDSHAKQIAALTQAIEKREDQVEDLQKKLVQATDDLNKSAKVLEEYKEKLKEKNLRNGSKEPEIVRELQKQVSDLKSRLSIMEQSVEDAEKEAQAKAEEVSNLIIQLREYESGEFGLNEAMEQVRELRQQKAVRDRHIEQLVQAGNQLQEEANQLEEENLALRDKLGLDVESVVRIEGVIARRQRDQNKIEELSRQVENANDSQIQLKLENRELNKTITALQDKLKDLGLQTKIELVLPSIPEKIDADNEKEEAQARLKEMIDENEALRKGMHEILDSIRSHDASSLIHIESEGLERLLEALDSRHVSGWYHPAMRLQAQLNTLYGINAALREQLHISRENETEKLAELQRAVTRIELMEKELMNAKFRIEDDGRQAKNEEGGDQEIMASSRLPESDNSDSNQVSSPKSTSLPKGAIEFIDKLKSHRALSKKAEGQFADGDQEVLKLMEKVTGMEEIMNETNERYDSDRESWQKVRAGLEKDLEIHSTKVSSLSKQLSEFKEQWEAIEKGPDEMQRKIAENAMRLGDLTAENETLRRKLESIQDIDSRMKVEYTSLQERFNESEFKNREVTGQLKCEKEILQNELQRCRALLNDSVLSSEMETVKNELNMLSGKHRGLLNKLTNLDTTGKNFEKRLQEEVLYWQKRSKEMESELLIQKQKDIGSQYKTQQETEDLVKALAELNIKEDVNRLKVEHIEKMNNLMTEQVTETESRLKQIEHDLRVLSEQNLAAQLTEAELRNQLVHCPSTNELAELKQKSLTLEKQLSEFKVERSKLAQEAELAREQLSTYEGLRRISDFRHDALQREILDLTAKSDDKATIGRLTREVTSAQMHEMMVKEELNKLLNRINSLEGYIRELEVRNKNLDEQLNKEANNHIDKYRSLIEIIHDLHQRYVGSLPLVTVDTMGNVIVHLQKEILLMKEVVMSEKKTTFELQNCIMHSNGPDMKINSRIQELNQRIEIENLQYRVKHAEEQAQRQEKLCREIQQELIEMDSSWEKKLMIWEQAQLKLLKTSEDAMSEDIQSPKSSPKEDAASQSTREASPGLNEQIRPQSAREEIIIPSIEPTSPSSEGLHQKEMIDSLRDQISQVSSSLNQETEKSAKCERRCNELVTQLQEVTNQLEDRKHQMISLKGELGQKNDQLIEKEREVMELKRAHTTQQPSDDNQDESTEILALKTTVTSLQNIVNQKEETISRYQTLLKEAREEHSTAIQAMRQEMNSLEEELNKQTIAASSRVMIEKESSRPEQVKVLVEKYLYRIHELEDEMGQARDQIKQLTTQLHDCHKALSAQHDSIKPIPVSQRSDKRVEYVLKKVDEAEEESNDENSSDKDNKKDYSDDESEATESENAKDHDGKDLKRDYNILADQLRDQNELIEKLNNTIAELKNNKGESVSRERLRSELERKKRRIEMLESKVEEDKVEISRLRHQLTSRPTRPEGVGSLKEEQLLKRIKALEEDLNEVHQKAEKERESHRNKCAEEVERWQERKRWQNINDKLRNQVKTQSTQIEALKSSQQRFRDTITRLERERNTLESKLKSVKGSIPAQSLIEDLEREVKQLKARNEFLKKTSEITSTSSLSEVIECQQRKIEALQIAQKGDSALTEEIERLQERKGQLQKANIRLEGENLKLKLELEKRRTVQLDSDGSPESDGSDRVVSRDTSNKKSKRSYEDLEKAVTVLRKVVEKLQNENKRLKTSETHQMRDDKGYMEKLQMELQKAQESYMDSLDKISSLEAHLKMEKENYRMVQEQLLQKARLLTKCKILLERAAVREKALNEQVSDLQKMIPPESLQGTYHNTLHW